MKKFIEKKSFVVSFILFLLFILVALFGNILAPCDPLKLDTGNALQASSAGHLLGTDEYGRDIFSRILIGIRPTLLVAFSSTFVATVVGTALGLFAAYSNSFIENIIMKLMNIILCFPAMLLAIMIVSFWGSGIRNLAIVIAIVYIPTFTRLAYGSALKIKNQEYIEAQLSLGAGYWRILLKGILPNIMASVIVQISLTFGNAIILESGLSFLGLGIVPPTPSLGEMVGAAQAYMTSNIGMLLWPASVLAALVLTVNVMGDSLRDILDPRLHR